MTVTVNGVVTLEISECSHVFWKDAESCTGEGEHFVDWEELTPAQRDHWNHLRDTLSDTIRDHHASVSREAA